jgi:hypothetical protein
MKSHIIAIFGPCTLKQAEEIMMRKLDQNTTKDSFGENKNPVFLSLIKDYSHPHLLKWIEHGRKTGRVLVIHSEESHFKIQEECDVVYKTQVLSSGNFIKLSLMKFREYIV